MVRIAELVNQIRRRLSEGQTLAQNPTQMAKQSVRKYGMLAYGKLSLPTDSDRSSADPKSSPESEEIASETVKTSALGLDSQPAEHPLPEQSQTAAVSQYTNQDANEDLSQWQPMLQPGERLQGGWWGVYTIKSCIHSQDWVRCYDGLQDNGSEPVWIYEYCFDDDTWSEEEIDERKRRFKHLIDLNLRLGQGSDFRIIRPKDVINPAGNRVYLITRPLPQNVTLKNFLEQQSVPWNRPQIERFLNQVLQSLQYLQTYLVNWPGDRWEQKLSHGNLSTDCLWIRLPDNTPRLGEHPFFIYLGRFSLWEHLFWPQQVPIAQNNQALGSIDDDFQALAHIVFALIRGYQSDDDPSDLSLWPEDSTVRALYPYVLQLLGQGENGHFKSVDSAISVLQTIPDTYISELVEEPQDVLEESEQTPTLPLLLLMIGGGVVLGLFTWLAWMVSFEEPRLACSDPCLLKQVSNPDDGRAFRYDIEAGSSWERGSFRTLTSPLENGSNYVTELHQTLQERDPAFLLKKINRTVVPKDLLIKHLRSNILDAALVQQVEALPAEIEKQVVAYDGIAIFVTHANARRRDSIPYQLEGRIQLNKLKQLFLNPDEKLSGARVEIYWPNDKTTATLLKNLLFDNEKDKAIFEQRRSEGGYLAAADGEPERMYERMLSDFTRNAQTGEEAIIGIGFNRISQLIGQCSVYPLALVEGTRSHHLFVDIDGSPIDNTTDLCGDKGTYWVNDRLFQPSSVAYPLAYEMAVVYHQPDEPCQRYEEGCAKGQILADKLLTPEGQYLLSEVGLVPVLPIRDIRRMQWSSMAAGGNL